MVDGLDLSSFYARRRADGWGRAAYDPKDDGGASDLRPCHGHEIVALDRDPLDRRHRGPLHRRQRVPRSRHHRSFATDHEDDLAVRFDQVLRLAAEIGLIRVGLVALASTRIKADASPGANGGD